MSSEIDVYNRIIIRWDTWAKQDLIADDKGRFLYKYKKFPLSRKIIDESILNNQYTVGVMTVLPVKNTVINPTIDIDNHDGNTDIINDVKIVYNALKAGGMEPYIEASAGELKDGAHIGVICKPTAAATAKRAIEVILKTTGLKHEVNPKQETIEKEGYGNLVKLPFQYNNRTKARSQIINPETLEPFERHEAIKYMMALPDTVFDEKEPIENPVQAIKEATTATTEPIKSVMGFDEFRLKKIKPCIIAAYKDKWKLHGNGDEGHNFRIAIAGNLVYNGATDEQVHDFFKIQDDYSQKATNYQLTSIKVYLAQNKKPMGCKNLMANCSALLNGMCATCSKKPKEKQIKQIKTDVGEALAAGMGVYRGNMELAEEFQKVCATYFDVSKNYWLWMQQEGYYKRIDDIDILSAVRKRCDENVIQSKISSEILRGIQITGRERAVKDVPDTWIHTYSGIVDYVTGERIKASPDYFLTCPVPHKIGMSENTPIIDKLFRSWVGEQYMLLYEWIAYLLVNHYPMHRMLILFGSGRNGKGQYIELLNTFIGLENSASPDLEKLMESRFETVKLYRKKLAVIDETNFNALRNTARIKAITGGSRIGAEFKGKDGFDFYNTAKITILTNNLPESFDKTEAFYSRCIIQEFKNKFDEGKSVVANIPESEYENLLCKCLKLLPDLMNRGKFTNEGTIEQKAEKYEKMSNPFPSFMKKELVEEPNGELPIWLIRDLYEVFCTKNGFRKVNEKEFTQMLKKEGYTTKRTWWGKNNWNTVFGLNTSPPYIFVVETNENKKENKPDEPDLPRPPLQNTHKNQSELCGKSGSCGSEHKQTVTDLTHKIRTYAKSFEIQNRTNINSSNLTSFCIDFVRLNHPKAPDESEYKPSDLKNIAAKILGVTPETKVIS
jgi:P4 family phage/plasmid primase-like protien